MVRLLLGVPFPLSSLATWRLVMRSTWLRSGLVERV